MRCPFCGFPDSKVVDSRDIDESIRRRRECLNPDCAGRFTTHERVQAVALYVIKKDGSREEFSREKVLSGLRTACEKRPLAPAAIEKLVDEIERVLYQANEPEVSTELIGEMVMDGLRALDAIAYVRFASVYRQFTDVCRVDARTGSVAGIGAPTGGAVAAERAGVLGHHTTAATGRTDNPNPYPPPGAAGASSRRAAAGRRARGAGRVAGRAGREGE